MKKITSKNLMKDRIRELVINKKTKFKTNDIMRELKPSLTNKITMPSNRVTKYINQNKEVHFDKKIKMWRVKENSRKIQKTSR